MFHFISFHLQPLLILFHDKSSLYIKWKAEVHLLFPTAFYSDRKVTTLIHIQGGAGQKTQELKTHTLAKVHAMHSYSKACHSFFVFCPAMVYSFFPLSFKELFIYLGERKRNKDKERIFHQTDKTVWGKKDTLRCCFSAVCLFISFRK